MLEDIHMLFLDDKQGIEDEQGERVENEGSEQNTVLEREITAAKEQQSTLVQNLQYQNSAVQHFLEMLQTEMDTLQYSLNELEYDNRVLLNSVKTLEDEVRIQKQSSKIRMRSLQRLSEIMTSQRSSLEGSTKLHGRLASFQDQIKELQFFQDELEIKIYQLIQEKEKLKSIDVENYSAISVRQQTTLGYQYSEFLSSRDHLKSVNEALQLSMKRREEQQCEIKRHKTDKSYEKSEASDYQFLFMNQSERRSYKETIRSQNAQIKLLESEVRQLKKMEFESQMIVDLTEKPIRWHSASSQGGQNTNLETNISPVQPLEYKVSVSQKIMDVTEKPAKEHSASNQGGQDTNSEKSTVSSSSASNRHSCQPDAQYKVCST